MQNDSLTQRLFDALTGLVATAVPEDQRGELHVKFALEVIAEAKAAGFTDHTYKTQN